MIRRDIIAAAGIAAVLLFSGADASARKKRVATTRPRLERLDTSADIIAAVDTIPASDLDSLKLSGYDKPLRSRRESLFVTNMTGLRLTEISLSISYYDMEGRELHHEDVAVGVDIPPGATRQILFPSWDRQLTFVYYRSERSSKGVLYKVKIAVTGARGK